MSAKRKDNNSLLNQSIFEFNQAMARYHRYPIFHKAGFVISTLIVTLQIVTTLHLLMHYQLTSIASLLLTLLGAYFLTDLINGLVHMIIDNNTHYLSFAGPFIAAFHLHHQQPQYSDNSLLKIYFFESGSKFWLVIYLVFVLFIQWCYVPTANVNLCLVAIGVFSSLAEVSHYLCHNAKSENRIIAFLQKYHILLSKEHHLHHHHQDNINYAFLNGVSDPIINFISKRYFTGYKNHSDIHAASYIGPQTSNRTPSKNSEN